MAYSVKVFSCRVVSNVTVLVLVPAKVVVIYTAGDKDTAVLNRPLKVKQRISFATKEHAISGFKCGER